VLPCFHIDEILPCLKYIINNKMMILYSTILNTNGEIHQSLVKWRILSEVCCLNIKNKCIVVGLPDWTFSEERNLAINIVWAVNLFK